MTGPSDVPRFPMLSRDAMSAEQQDVYQRKMVGPWADLRGLPP